MICQSHQPVSSVWKTLKLELKAMYTTQNDLEHMKRTPASKTCLRNQQAIKLKHGKHLVFKSFDLLKTLETI